MLGEMAGNATIEAVRSAAQEVARRRHHPVVHAMHVLAALFAARGMARRIRRRGLDADHLATAVERALDDAPSVAGYRDAVIPKLCPSVERAFERAKPLVEMYGSEELAIALEDAPELRGAFRPYVLDESLVERLRREAPGRDIADAMTWLLAHHLDLSERLVDGGLDLADLTTRCGASYREIVPQAIDTARSTGAPAVEAAPLIAVLTREIAYAAGYELPLIGDALDLLLHGPPPDDRVSDDGPAEVVFVNDPLTPFATVQTILTTHFGMNEDAAYATTCAIDICDEAVAATTAGAPARELAAFARRAARRDGYPLRVITRAPAY
jgi:ATP-dependent Clp protease adapter protein ClpS